MASQCSYFIPSKGLLKLRQYFFVRKWGEEIMLQIFKCCLVEEDPSKTILKVLEDNGVAMDRKSRLNKDEINKMSNEPLESLDITALYKIYDIIWDKRLNQPRNQLTAQIKANPDKELVDIMKASASDELREKMTKYPDYELISFMRNIKDKRNDVSHVKEDLSETTLDERLHEFGEVLKDGLDKAAALYPCHKTEFIKLKVDVGDSILNIQEKIREKYEPTNPEHLKKFQSEIVEFGDQLHDFIRERSVAQLIILYSDLCRISPFDWLCDHGLINPGVIMIMLKMDMDQELHEKISSPKSILIDQNEILDKKDPKGNDPTVIIISGDAGSGKTTLLCWLLEMWQRNVSNEVLGFSSFHVVLYMEFRNHDHDNFDKYLQDLLPHQVSEFGFDQVKSSILLSNCLILCDGYDERNPNSLKLFEEILKLKWNRFKIIVTTRPVNTAEVTQTVNRSRRQRMNLTMLGLRDDDIKDLISKLTNHFVQEAGERHEILEGISSTYASMTHAMRLILKNPLYFNLYSLLYIDRPDVREGLRNETNLFTQLNNHRSERLTEKLGLHDKREELREFEQFYKEWSLRYYIEEKYEISEADIQVFVEICKRLKLDFDSLMSWYFNIKHSRKGLKLEKVYSYRHRVDQEFAAAGAICDKVIKLYDEKRKEFDQLLMSRENVISHVFEGFKQENSGEEKGKQVQEFMKFVTGILFTYNKHLLYLVIGDIFGRYGKSEFDEHVLLDHVLQTNCDANVVDAFAETMTNSNFKERLGVRSKHLSCVAPLLSRANLKDIAIHVAYEDFDDFHLMPALVAIVQKGTELYLYTGNDLEKPIPEKYIKAAKTCVHFHGSLSKGGIQFLPPSIKNLDLTVKLQDLPYLAAKLPDLVHLKYLSLLLDDDGSFTPGCPSPIPFTGQLSVRLLRSDKDSKDKTRLTKLVQSFWPTSSTEETKRSFDLNTHHYLLADEISLLMNSLKNQHLDSIMVIPPPLQPISAEEEEEQQQQQQQQEI